jgi:glutaredoxin
MRAPLKLGLALSLMLCVGIASAQVYRWKDAKGVTHFSDTPPATAVPVEKMQARALKNGGPTLPYEVALAVSNHPVTLYTTSQCAACDQGRAMLQARGIPYVEKTVVNASDHAALRKAGGDSQLPLLLIGNSKYIGFEQASWDIALTAASYPAQNVLRPDYQQPAPMPAAALGGSDAQTPAAPADGIKSPKLPAPKAAPDFQF